MCTRKCGAQPNLVPVYGISCCRFWSPYVCVHQCGACMHMALSRQLPPAGHAALRTVHTTTTRLTDGVRCVLIRQQTPGGAILVGFGAGCISTLGFQYLTPFLDRTIGLGDTCGE